MIRKIAFLGTLSFLIANCSGAPKLQGSEIGPRLSEGEYKSIFNSKTKTEKRYEGFYQLYEAHVTFLDSEVQTAILQRKSDVYRWNLETAQREREKMFQENSNSTTFVLVFYAPRVRIVDLHKKNSIWRVHLDVNGQRYESHIKKISGPFEDIQAIYPTHNRFTTAYELTFKIPLGAVENSNPKFLLTSTIGTTELDF